MAYIFLAPVPLLNMHGFIKSSQLRVGALISWLYGEAKKFSKVTRLIIQGEKVCRRVGNFSDT